MTVEQIFKLVDAGFTKEDILKLNTTTPKTETPAEPEKTPQKAPETPPPTSTPETAPDRYQELLDRLGGLERAVQSNNIKNASFETVPGDDVDDVLASIINPKEK